jgi:hypothetical protein
MGMFTHSYVIDGSTPEALLAFYRAEGTRAFIYPGERNTCAICDDNDDEPDLDLLAELTKKLQAKALLGQVFDSSVFVSTVFNCGVAIDEYIDYPGHVFGLEFGGSVLHLNRELTIEKRATEWASLFEVPNQEDTLAKIFRLRIDYLFAEDFHESVLQALMLPTAMVGQYFVEIERAYMTESEARKVLLYANGSAK